MDKSNRWYPDRSHFKSFQEFDAHVQTLNIVYKQQDQLEKAIADIQKVAKVAESNVGQTAGGPLNTKIVGLAVTPGQPANGDTIRYDAKSGQFKFGA